MSAQPELITGPPGKAGGALRYLTNSLLKDSSERCDWSICADQKFTGGQNLQLTAVNSEKEKELDTVFQREIN